MLVKCIKKIIAYSLAAATIFTVSAGLFSCSGAKKDETEIVERTIFAMDTVITLSVSGAQANEACDEIAAMLAEFEAIASMHMEGSDVARVNANAGIAPVEISEDVYYNLARAVQASEQTGGLFDITIGAITDIWGVGSDNPRVPSQSEIDEKLALVDYTAIELSLKDGVHTAMLRERGQKIDLGGIAKGYSIDLMKDIFDSHDITRAIISVGGNVMAYKDKEGQPFVVSIRHPEKEQAGTYVCLIGLADAIISTTGGYERFFEQDGVAYHHVMDPRTGYPASSGLLSVSVVDTNGLRADYMSTALFVGGLDYCLTLMQADEVEAIVIDENNNVYINSSLRDSIDEQYNDSETYNFIFV
jgi:Membrane-associated lipoprotein involved in thiamine biosynthesis